MDRGHAEALTTTAAAECPLFGPESANFRLLLMLEEELPLLELAPAAALELLQPPRDGWSPPDKEPPVPRLLPPLLLKRSPEGWLLGEGGDVGWPNHRQRMRKICFTSKSFLGFDMPETPVTGDAGKERRAS